MFSLLGYQGTSALAVVAGIRQFAPVVVALLLEAGQFLAAERPAESSEAS